ncbi:hypothetical protein [Acidovorax temperans]|uniref:hypothetical protein n=1 Tax=Acidovorax temperans TaxID=80878 RepID=UPI00289732AB|nr:hypothetical protein [Acidovorax temperans]
MTSAQKVLVEAKHAHEISSALWDLDPMRTGCKGDATMQDEYEFQSQEIVSMIGAGTPIREAVIQVFDKWFWEDCLISGTSTSRLDAIVEKISKITC